MWSRYFCALIHIENDAASNMHSFFLMLMWQTPTPSTVLSTVSIIFSYTRIVQSVLYSIPYRTNIYYKYKECKLYRRALNSAISLHEQVGADPLRDDGLMYVARLREVDAARVGHTHYAKHYHGFMSTSNSNQLQQDLARFLDAHPQFLWWFQDIIMFTSFHFPFFVWSLINVLNRP